METSLAERASEPAPDQKGGVVKRKVNFGEGRDDLAQSQQKEAEEFEVGP